MTEQDWLTCNDPQRILASLQRRASPRKRRLFACACCRVIWGLLPGDAWRRAVEVAERSADGAAGKGERAAALKAAKGSCGVSFEAAAAAYACYAEASHLHACSAARHAEARAPAARPKLAGLLRDLFGNPFRRVALDPAWRSPAVVALAQAAYEERSLPAGTLDLGRLAVLADALEDAGCDNADVLTHLRGPGPHVRGCWVLDGLLGKD